MKKDDLDMNENNSGNSEIKSTTKKQSIVLPVIFVVAVAVILIIINLPSDNEQEENTKKNKTKKNENVSNIIGIAPNLEIKSIKVTKEKPKKTEIKLIKTQNNTAKAKRGGKKTLTPEMRKRQVGLLASNRSSKGSNKKPDESTAQKQMDSLMKQYGGLAESDKADGLEAKLTATNVSGARASILINRNMFITKGTFIDCVLETAINSDLSGMTTCRVTRDIYSTSGNVLLVERGSRIVGEYQGGMEKGVARIFVLWTRIETPNGVMITLNSPSSGALGKSGNSGFIDRHFWERFGYALLLSTFGDASAATRSHYSKDNSSNNNFSETGDAIDTMAVVALKDNIGIKPTLIKNQGEHINVFVARDLDFRGVYSLDVIE